MRIRRGAWVNAEDPAVYWPGQPEPTHGVHNHKEESIAFFKMFENKLDNRPYKVLIVDGDWTCSSAHWIGESVPRRLVQGCRP